MKTMRSCQEVAAHTGFAQQDVWARVKRWAPELLGPRYIRKECRK